MADVGALDDKVLSFFDDVYVISWDHSGYAWLICLLKSVPLYRSSCGGSMICSLNCVDVSGKRGLALTHPGLSQNQDTEKDLQDECV